MVSLFSKIEALASTLANPRIDTYVKETDRILESIQSMGDPACIPALLPFISDTDPAQEIMWSIVHLIESFDDQSYFGGLLTGLPTLEAKAPGWAATIHARILNDPASILGYIKVLAFSTSEQRIALRKVVSTIVREEPTFEASSKPLVQILDSLDAQQRGSVS